MPFQVTATSLNLRSRPKVSPRNRLAVLPNGHRVEKISEASVPGWWQVSTTLNGATLTGFVSSAHLAPTEDISEAPGPSRITEVHLQENRTTAARSSVTGRAFPLGEPGRPRRGNGGPDQRRAELVAIVNYLDVENSARYRPGGSTFCNIYAYDYCYLSGVYLPRVWWTDMAIAELSQGRSIPVRYGENVAELSANSLYDWLREFGNAFGWSRMAGLDALQEAANNGGVGVICAQRTDLNRSGHICLVVPEVPPHTAARRDGSVSLPLQSQAGTRNFSFSCGTTAWWTGSQFRAFGFWVHP
jgi:hypothetical protein